MKQQQENLLITSPPTPQVSLLAFSLLLDKGSLLSPATSCLDLWDLWDLAPRAASSVESSLTSLRTVRSGRRKRNQD